MSMMPRGPFALIALALAAAACSSAPSVPQIRLDTTNAQQPAVEVTGVSRRDLSALSQANLTDEEWSALLRVTVKRAAAAGDAASGRGALRDCRVRPLRAALPARSRPRVRRRLRPGAAGARRRAAPAGRAGSSCAACRRADPLHRRGGRVPGRRRHPRESAPDVRAVLRTDGAAGRARPRRDSRRARTRDAGCAPAARHGALERRSDPVHAPLRSGQGQERHPAQSRDGPSAPARETASRSS